MHTTIKRTAIIISLLTIATQAFAADYKQFYLVNGKTVSAEEAILSSLKGNEAFRCQSVESKLSKSGTSIALRNIKKPRKN